MPFPFTTLEGVMKESSPSWPRGNLGSVGVDFIPVQLSTASIDIHLLSPKPASSLPQVADHPEEQDNREGKVRLEEALNSAHARFTRRSNDGGVELQRSQCQRVYPRMSGYIRAIPLPGQSERERKEQGRAKSHRHLQWP